MKYRYNPTVRSSDYYGDVQNQSFHDPFDMLYSNWYDAVNGPEGNYVRDRMADQGSAMWNDWQRYQGDADYAFSDWDGQYRPGQTYTPEERAGILRTEGYRGAMTGDDAWRGLYQTDAERMAVAGDPYAAGNRFASGGLDVLDQLNRYDERIQGTMGEGTQRLRGVGDLYRDTTNASLLAGADSIRGAAGDPRLQMRDEALGLSSDPRLQASAEFMSGYRFGPEDTAKLETQAGAAIGTRYRQNREDLGQRIAAHGYTDPLARAALTQRSEAEQARESADAALGASVRGRGMELETLQGREGMRLSAAQRAAQLGLSAEDMRLGAAGRAAALRTQAEQGLLDAALGTAGRSAELGQRTEAELLGRGLSAQSDLARQRQQAGQWYQSNLADLSGAADAAGSARAMAMAQARAQAAGREIEGRYTQAMNTEDRARAGESQLANQRLNFEEQRRAYLANQANASRQGAGANLEQQASMWRARQQARQGAAGQYGDQLYRNEALSRTNPGLADRLASGAAGAAASLGFGLIAGPAGMSAWNSNYRTR